MFVIGKPFHARQIFVSEGRAYLSRASYSAHFMFYSKRITTKIVNYPNKLARMKHSSLFVVAINDEENGFIELTSCDVGSGSG